MKLNVILLFMLGIVNFTIAQDTIQFISSKTPLVVKVSEIGIDEIKYHRIDNLDGPLYVASKNDVKYIKYANGHVDSVNVTRTGEQITVNQDIKIYKSVNPISTNEKIIITGNKLSYNGKPVGESRLFRLITNVPIPEKKALLYKEYLNMKSYKKKQYLFGFVGLGAGVGLAYIGFMSSFVLEDATPFAVCLAAGATIGITGAVISGINKSKRTKKRIEIANLYNN
jgi:hypothetical protein